MVNGSTQERIEFFENWQIYRDVIDHDYMHHSRIISEVRRSIMNFKHPRILELGCGDAFVVSQSANQWEFDYLGIDQSKHAINLAKASLSASCPNAKVDFIEGEMLHEVSTLDAEFDIIIAGYCIHHLSSVHKQKAFSKIVKLLSTGGVFIFYDIEMKASESVEEYNKRATQFYEKHWINLSRDKVVRINAHATQCDIPESEVFYRMLFNNAGFKQLEKVFSDENELYALYLAKLSPFRS